jgi:hypothetical protein
MRRLAVLVLLALVGAAAQARADETPFIYHQLPLDAPLRLDLETAVGTRESRPFEFRGVEQTAQVLWQAVPRLELAVRGGVFLGEGPARTLASVEGSVLALDGLRLGAGYVHDYRGTSILLGRAIGFTEVGRFDLAASALVEVPVTPARDAVDVILGVAAAVRVQDRVRLGLEVLGEDLEGLWDPDETEGGARVLVGPSVWLGLADKVDLRLSPALSFDHAGTGFLGRLAVGVGF